MFSFLLCCMAFPWRAGAQTDFAPGDIMFTGFDSDDLDAFSFVLLTDVVSGTVIYITDRGWDNPGGNGFRDDSNGEGTISFTFNAAYTCGTEFFFNDVDGANDWEARDANGNLVGTVAILTSTSESPTQDGDGIELGCTGFGCPDGDQLFIYQDPEPTPSSQGSFVTAIHVNGNGWNADNFSDAASEKPTGLASNQVVIFSTELDNVKYDCDPRYDLAANLRAAIDNDNGSGGAIANNSNNWQESDNNINLQVACSFCCGLTAEVPVISAPSPVQTNQMFTLQISGNLAPGEVWELYTTGCGSGPPAQTTTGNSFTITAPGTTGTITYYVRSSEDLDCPSDCDAETVCVVSDLYATCTSCSGSQTTCGTCFLPEPLDNPNLDSGCYSMRLILVIDESGSIGGNAEDVEDGVLAFLNAINGQDAEVALIEFSDLARQVNNYEVVDVNYISDIDGYFNGVQYNMQTYVPGGGTNWHDAMIKVDALPTADLILFFTDGEPTAWTNNGGTDYCGNGATTQTPEIVNPVKLANKMKSEGTHMFMLGVGTVTEANLQAMSGFDEYQIGVNTLGTSDYSIGNFTSLADDLESFILELCRTHIVIEKDVLGPICNGKVTFRFRVINTGTESNATQVIVGDTFPNGYANPMYPGLDSPRVCIGAACGPGFPPNGFYWLLDPIQPGDTVTLLMTVDVLDIGNYVNTAWASGNNTNVDSDTFSDELEEDVAPTISCPPDASVECSEGIDPDETGSPTANDVDGPPPLLTYTDMSVSGPCPSEYSLVRTWTATDTCGNTASCTQDIVVTDNTPPVITCPPNVTITCLADTSPGALGSATAVDACAGSTSVNYTDELFPGICALEFVILRTWSTTDPCGNANSCVQTITVDDSTPPALLCPSNVTIACGASTDPAQTGKPKAFNNCGDTIYIFEFVDEFVIQMETPQCQILRTWYVEDDCGNESTCVQSIVIVDTTDPVITCPANVTISCVASTLPANTGTATGTDNCDATTAISYTDVITNSQVCTQEYTIERTWKADDDCGNSSTCIQVITIDDSTGPVLSCPANVTVQCTASTLPANTGNATATDQCDLTPAISFADVTVGGACPQELTITRTWTALDDCGNSSTCVQTIFVDDSTVPVLTCPANITILCTESTLPANTGLGTASDNCDTAALVNFTDVTIAGSCPQHYTIQRTWSATDDCSNSSTCIQQIVVNDPVVPTINCPPDITIECTADTSPENTGSPVSSDNCDSSPQLTFTNTIIAGSCPQEYTIQQKWTATDDCGNTSTCMQIITVDDSVMPVITCPADITIECTESTLPANTGNATGSDNCTAAVSISHTNEITPGSCPHMYLITRTWKATDACGNSSTCIQVINIKDSTAPTLNCPADITIECTASTLPGTTGNATGSDNCTSSPLIVYSDVTTAGSCPQEYVITRTWTATDECGNMTTCEQIIEIDDSTEPVLNCPEDVTIECTESTLPDDLGFASGSDNCDASPSIDYNDVTIAGDCVYEYTITRTWTAIDACGNEKTCQQVINIIDSTPPEITCPPDATIQCYENLSPDSLGVATGSDNCDTDPIISYNDVTMSGPAPNGYTIKRTWTISDACDNVSTCLQTIIVENPLMPEMLGMEFDTICSGSTVTFMADDPGLGPVMYSWQFGSGSTPPSATGIGPHNVVYNFNATNGSIGAFVRLTLSLTGCASVMDTVANIHVNAIPNPAIMAPTTNLCYYTNRNFKPVAAQMSGFSYEWNFGAGATPATASTYGPHAVQYSTTGAKQVRLIVFSNEAGASCGDTATLGFNVIACPGNVTGRVEEPDSTAISGVLVRIYPDNDYDGLPDPGPAFKSANTLSTGVYSLTAIPYGQWVVVQTDKVGYYSLYDIDESDDNDSMVYSHPNDNIIPVTMKANEIDAHNIFVDVTSPSIISGYVFEDFNNNGLPSNDEAIPNVRVKLFHDADMDGLPDSGGIIDTAYTSGIGFYTFGDLVAGDYVLQEEQPAMYTNGSDIDLSEDLDSVPNTNMMDDLIPVTLEDAERDENNYFKEQSECAHLVTNPNDSGPGSLRFMMTCANSGDTILFHSSLAGQTIHLSDMGLGRIVVNKNIHLISGLSPRVNIQSSIPGLFVVNSGNTFEVKNINIVSGLSGFPGAAIENYGSLILWDVFVNRNPALPAGNYLIYNAAPGFITTKGNIQIEVD